VASLAKELGALTVAVVTKPFAFEGSKRRRQAEQGLAELASVADTVIAIPNDRLLDQAPADTSIFEAFRLADDVLRQAVQGISDIITTPGLINRDFSDIRSIMVGMGYAMMGTAEATGPGAAVAAADKAIGCPLLDAGGVKGARGVLINITGSRKLALHEVNQACTLIRDAAQNDDVEINFGVVLNEALGEDVKITVIATGFQRENLPEIHRRGQGHSVDISAPVSPVIEFGTPAPATQVQPVAVAAVELPVPVPAPVVAAAPAPEPIPEPIQEVAPARAEAAPMHVNGSSEAMFDDLDLPAILRRDRRLVQ
jgi:cell division protein FtsZ